MTNSNICVANPTLHVPVDIIIDILSRLPVKPLLRFTSVSKSWYALIKSPDFISKHLKATHSNALLVTEESSDFEDYAFSLLYEDTLNSATVLDLPFVGIRDEDVLLVVGVFNGLVCVSLSYRECQLILFNPATRQLNQVPHWRWWDKFMKIQDVTMGFGFDPRTDDYKLIRTVRYKRLNGEIINHAEIYSLNSDNWREIEMPFFLSLSFLVAIPGIFYWETRDLAYPDKTIVSFDMSDEVFLATEGPEFIRQNREKTYHKFVELKEQLALVVTSDERYFTVWVLNDDEKLWSKKFEVGPVIGRLKDVGSMIVVGCSKNGDLVFKGTNRSWDIELLLYDRKRREIKSLPFDNFGAYYRVFGFKESLLPVKKNDESLRDS